MRYDSPLVVEEIHVGVILDMKSREGRIVLSCISAAVSDFYQLHNHYSTRVVLHSRDSKGEPLHALSAAFRGRIIVLIEQELVPQGSFLIIYD
ncbi:hypothetical protein ACE6H2_007116 [Prunus campanulata]